MAHQELLEFTAQGIYCPEGDFYIDPWKPVDRAVITHAHADHARPGHRHYLAHRLTTPILRLRLGADISAQSLEYSQSLRLGSVTVSLHPAGHVPGSAQVRLERAGEVWVAGGDYKTRPDGLSTPWQPIRCHSFITESTFGLPIYRWPDPALVAQDIHSWWAQNRANGKTSVLTAYSLGKAQRLLHLIGQESGPIHVHSAIRQINDAYRGAGLDLADFPTWKNVSTEQIKTALLIMPPAAVQERRSKLFASASIAHASGWMTVRGHRRRLALDRGFVVSDHADWEELNQAIQATGAERIFVTHGQIETFVRWLRENGYDARPVETRFTGDAAEDAAPPAETTP